MEDFDQGYGSIAYVTTVPPIKPGTVLKVSEPHDYAQIFLDGEYIGKMDRRLGETELLLPQIDKDSKLEILVEAMGRINFGIAIKDYKGITENVSLLMKSESKEKVEELKNWNVYLIPDEFDFYKSMPFHDISRIQKKENGRYPRGIYRGKFYVEKPSDTFLLFDKWGKGLVYVNGHPLGRIWEIGPQQTLYTPGVWLKEGENEIFILDICGPREYVSQGLKKPVLDMLQGEALKKHRQEGEILDLGVLPPVYGGAFPSGNGWKTQTFEKPQTGRYIAIEALSSATSEDVASIAEFYVLDAEGKRISREPWTIYYADSEDTSTGNHTADKIFDLQESTFWSTENNVSFPHYVVIDLGKEEKIGGIECLPRAENGAPGAINEFKVYVSQTPFKK